MNNNLFINRLTALSQKGDFDAAISELNTYINSPLYSAKNDIGYADLVNILYARKEYLANDSTKAQMYLRKNIEKYNKLINWADFTEKLNSLDGTSEIPFDEDEANFLKYLVMKSILSSEELDNEIARILEQCPKARMRSIDWKSYVFFFNPFKNFISTREELENNWCVEEVVAEPTDLDNE